VDTQAIAARLTAIAKRLDLLNQFGHTRDEIDLLFLLAHVETLTQQVAELTEELAGRPVLVTEWQKLTHRAVEAEQQRDAAIAAMKDALQRMSDCARCGARTAAPAQETERGR
jgi:BioD-like phosphotransacetylase family protein